MNEMKFLKFNNVNDGNVLLLRIDSIVTTYFNIESNTVNFNTNHPHSSILSIKMRNDYQLKRLMSFLSPYENTVGSQLCVYEIVDHEVITFDKDE